MMLRVRVFLLLMLCLGVAPAFGSMASELILLNGENQISLFPDQVEHYQDKSNNLTLEQVLSTDLQELWQVDKEDDLNFGYTKSAYWIRFKLRSKSEKKWYLLLDVMLGVKPELYIFPVRDSVTSFPGVLGSDRVKPLEAYRRFSWSLDLPRDQTYEVYLKATNGDSILQLPVEFLSADEFVARTSFAYLLLGCLYFAMIVLAIYQFVNAAILRESSYATLGVFIVAMMVAFHRSSPVFGWLDFTLDTTSHFATTPILIMIGSFLLFSRQTLDTKQYLPKVDRLFIGFVVLAVLMAVFIGFALPYSKLYAVGLGALSLILIIFTGVYLGKRGDKAARNFALIMLIPFAVHLPANALMLSGFEHWKTERDVAMLISTLVFMFFIAVMQAERVRAMREEAQKNEVKALITNKLSKFVGPEVYREIYEGKIDAKLETHSKELTVFFSDIVNFTDTSEQMQIEELAKWLNNYLNEMAQIALGHQGAIDKFIGDAVMIYYGDHRSAGRKQDAVNCVRMAIAMQKKAKALGIEIRIGINSGRTTVGNFGAEARMDYTVVGRTVNLAARLEQSSKPGRILVSEATYQLIASVIPCEEYKEIMVKGFVSPVKTYWVTQSA